MEKIAAVTFLVAAESELHDAIAYYNEQSEGLGFDFAAEVLRTIERIVQYPQAWSLLSKKERAAAGPTVSPLASFIKSVTTASSLFP